VTYTNNQGVSVLLDDNRRPALYSQSFGDCLGNSESLIKVSRFDASLYMDNMTVSFHIAGTTDLLKESVMGEISIPPQILSPFLIPNSLYRRLCLWRE
jgi:ML-like domain